MSARILIAGFQHETNTFAPAKAGFSSFVNGEGHPPLTRGEAIYDLREINIPIGGFIQAAQDSGLRMLPVIWAAASPSAHVTEDAYERIAGEILEAAARLKPDGVYLDLHGAMVAEHADDGEGVLLARLRDIVGADVPIVASLDLHANVTPLMLASATGLVAYRTYPHVDMAATGARAEALLQRALRGPLHRADHRIPFLIPINGMCTLVQPARGMYEYLAELESGAVHSLSFTPGFPAADFPGCGPVVWGYGDDAEAVSAAVTALRDRMLAQEAEWAVPLLTPDDAVRRALELSSDARRPVVIADTQDNPGAGGTSDTMGMVRALLAHDARDAAAGLICDPEAAAAAHRAGVGARITLALGGRSGTPGDTPLHGEYEVMNLSAGDCRYDGPMMHGMSINVGPVALLRIQGVSIAVSSQKAQMIDRNLYRMAGIQPEAMRILVNKSSVHFRADFQPIAEAILVAKAPGPMLADPAELPWTRLAPGMRTRPLGQPMATSVVAR
ncbi:microcystin degradation protein MlrC [Bordetella genomosp. 8]|uniref:Microcystinase C n=1 Tax=Bordetella genomosp. 8 TaxID=1416806 RepID=A0A1W6YLV3_9BORD|nr:M81 family metallopeptidase [Bordetella genomosp. 8]ARP81929.1 microcystin degradation protein MlrC [Bordetella genomosp. 8]